MKSYSSSLATVATGLLIAQAANAADIVFNFRVNSSGSDLYACDAGIFEPAAGDLDGPFGPLPPFTRGSAVQSTVNARVGDYNGGDEPTGWAYKVVAANVGTPFSSNFRTAVYDTGFINGNTIWPRVDRVLDNVNSSVTSPAGNQLTFNLASDYYGARYFIDFCYRSPNLEYISGNYDYLVRDMITATGIVGSNYRLDANLEVESKVVCDTRESTASSDFSSTDITDSFASLTNPLLGLGGAGVQTASAGPVDFSIPFLPVIGVFDGATTHQITTTGAPARYCVVRYIFREQSFAKRKWDLNTATFAIDLHVNNVTAPQPVF